MSSAQSDTDVLIDALLHTGGHPTAPTRWGRSYRKLQCPECGAIHDPTATRCKVCAWQPH
jgi:hypothetical protein